MTDTKTKNPKRTPEELAEHHREQARKHELRAKYAKDPTLKAVAKMHDELGELEIDDPRIENDLELNEKHSAALAALWELHVALEK